MRRGALALVAVLACLATTTPAPAAPYGDPKFYVGARYVEGQEIFIKLRHDNHNRVRTMSETWDIYNEAGEIMAQYYWPEDERWLAPHQYRTWVWDQRQACYGACQNVWEGDPAPPGRYRVVTTMDGQEISKWFSIGAYFHIAFEGRPHADFVVYSNRPEWVEAMRAELGRPDEERQVVLGTVKTRKPGYNPDWSYVLAPNTVELAEASIEVCDGSPYYVEHHLKAWRDKTWCPWSSHVAFEGS